MDTAHINVNLKSVLEHPKLELRGYQLRILEKSVKYLTEFFAKKANGVIQPNTSATILIESPTGSGKTVCGQALLKVLSMGIINGEKFNPLWIAHRRELLNQANETNNDFFNIDDFETMSLFDRHASRYYGQKNVILIDEAQHDAAASASTIHGIIKPEIIIGLTATPYRTDKAKLCFEKVIKDAGIHQLIREGYLAPFKQWVIHGEWTPENVARAYLQDPVKWGPSVSYWLKVEEAIEMANIINAAGGRAEAITGESPRDEILEAFHNGEISHLSNCMVLTEGFDAPKLQTAFVRPSSKSPTVQMAGRVFRKHQTKQWANVVQNQDTHYPFTRHAASIEQWVEEDKIGWRSIDGKNLDPTFKEMRNKIAHSSPSPLPEFILKRKAKGTFSGLIDRRDILL